MEESSYVTQRIPHNRKNINYPVRSRDYAWFLGVLVGDGYCSSIGDSLILGVKDKEFRGKFARVGKELFGLEARLSINHLSKKNKKWNDAYLAAFHSVELTDFLGDFREERWTDTVYGGHSWIFRDKEYVWGFLNGYFDSDGCVSDPVKVKNNQHRIRISTAYRKSADFIVEILNRVGIEGKIEKSSSRKEGIKDVTIRRWDHMKRFAQNVYSSVPERERRLNRYRNAKVTIFPGWLYNAYWLTKDMRKKTGWGAYKIANHPRLKYYRKYGITYSTIRNWVHCGNDPVKNSASYRKIEFN